ncbi:MAG: zinc ribbon domain-containing protein [Thermoplasmata archaeon]|nr:zinc ribbon domain-containing protein [Thermoplasmata archaeon]
MLARRSLVCNLAGPLPHPALALLSDFRLMVNRGIREAIEQGLTAQGSLTKYSQGLARELRVNGVHSRTPMDTALSLDAGHRRRLRKGARSRVPYVRSPFLVADDSTFHLNPDTGHLRLSLRNSEWAGLDLRQSDWHRSVLADRRIKQLRLNANRAVLVLELDTPEPYTPQAILALDTNERSLDGVLLEPDATTPLVVPYPDVATIQHRHFARRRRLGRKKAHDRRVGRKLLGREGRREHRRIVQRLHLLTKMLVAQANSRGAALSLEDLHLPRGGGHGRRMRRRLSSWPQRELHRQLEYKAEEQGVPVLKVNPRNTSKTCPRFGEIKERRSRVGRVFVCASCGWRCDRQLNAGLNICQIVLREAPKGPSNSGLGGLWLSPDALPKDAMKLLYSPGHAGAHGRSGRERRIEVAPRDGGGF